MADRMIAKGKVTRLFPCHLGCFISLENPEYTPKDGYFLIKLDNSNYNALFSTASIAALSRRELLIRTVNDISPDENGEVWYLMLDF